MKKTDLLERERARAVRREAGCQGQGGMGKARKKKKGKSVDEEDGGGAGKRRKARQGPPEPHVDVVADVVSLGVVPPSESDDSFGAMVMIKQRLERWVLLDDAIFSVPGALTPEECASWIEWGEREGFKEAKQAASAYFAHRDNGRISTHSPEIAQVIFDRLRKVVPPTIDDKKAVGCSSNIRLYRYMPGQRFGKHIDESCMDQDAWSEFTLLFYLNDENLEGGETNFYAGSTGAKQVLSVVPQRGLALLRKFLSHILLQYKRY